MRRLFCKGECVWWFVTGFNYLYSQLQHRNTHIAGFAGVLLALSIGLSGCLPSPYFQKQEAIPNNAWNYNFKPVFRFNITDTSVSYRTYFIIQHTQAYPYCNLWLWLYIKTPGDSTIKRERLNLTMADATGRWLGRGMGAIYEERIGVNFGESVTFKRPGTYEIALEQNMRVNPLPEVLHVGLRVERATPNGKR
ncbi:MAG: gliding motility lipoprotein GldH [Chitinophagia bacterium]|nr:gliding motility lipoprotein GldH [Chitinophagia bacterium]